MKTAIFNSAVAELTKDDFMHPDLRLCKFIFCDDQPNENGQGVEYEEFAEIKKTAIGTPFKMKFLGESAAGHVGSIPIGYIRDMWEEKDGEVNKLIAVATIFANEYPDEAEWLHDKLHEGKAPGVSFEMGYSDSIVKNGIEWLKKVVTKAATIVRNPAYGNRTAILALASNRNISEDALISAIAQIHDDSKNEGGNIRMEKELEEAKAEVERLTKALAEKEADLDVLTTKNTTLETSLAEKNETIAAFQKQEVVQTRVDALAAIGYKFPEEDDKLEAKTKFIGDLSEEAFAEYKSDLETALAENKTETKDAFASLRQPVRVPRLAAASADNEVSVDGLKGKFKSISRSSASTESE